MHLGKRQAIISVNLLATEFGTTVKANNNNKKRSTDPQHNPFDTEKRCTVKHDDRKILFIMLDESNFKEQLLQEHRLRAARINSGSESSSITLGVRAHPHSPESPTDGQILLLSHNPALRIDPAALCVKLPMCARFRSGNLCIKRGQIELLVAGRIGADVLERLQHMRRYRRFHREMGTLRLEAVRVSIVRNPIEHPVRSGVRVLAGRIRSIVAGLLGGDAIAGLVSVVVRTARVVIVVLGQYDGLRFGRAEGGSTDETLLRCGLDAAHDERDGHCNLRRRKARGR
uniref:Uncharacterized protein n=1 Tax=Anopheles farauti TaxID=69004 RepID=A0A182QQH0_9DIPT